MTMHISLTAVQPLISWRMQVNFIASTTWIQFQPLFSVILIQDKHDVKAWDEECAAATEYHSTKSGILTEEETMPEHARKKPRNFSVFDSLKKADSAQISMDNVASHTQEKARSFQVSMNDEPQSPSLQKRQLCSLSMAQGKKESSFLGFQSVFSFL